MKVTVVKGLCQGHAMCRFRAPEVYVLNEHGYNVMDPFEVPAGLENQAREGADECPEQAILIEEEV